jgi:hypothetical protein
MKKHLLFIAFASLFTTLASATDLYVREGGAGGAYSTISAAITASANGDRIIIQPKAGTTAYIENLTINKSLTFVSETNFGRYIVEGNVTISPLAGRVVIMHNMNLVGGVSVPSATTAGRTTVSIYNSLAGSMDASQVNTTLNLSGCTVSDGVSSSHGRYTSNNLGGLSVYHTALDTSLAADDVEIFGNIIGNGIYVNQKNYAFKILNNFITQGLVNVYGVKNGSNNEITNNVIMGSDQSPVIVILPAGNTGAVSIMNNVLNSLFGSPQVSNANSNATVNASYNMSGMAFTTSTNVTSANNTGSASMTTNTITYTVTGANVNAGSTATAYTDLDLSRNDIGNFGGSNSWANYWPTGVGNKAQVNYLVTPRIITTGTTTLNVTGSGFSK